MFDALAPVRKMVTLRDITQYLETIAPSEHTVHGLDRRIEIGPQTEEEQLKTTINRVLVATYPSARIVTRASQDKINLLITGRPLFASSMDRLDGLDLIRVRILTKNYISTCFIGSSWVSAKNGLADALIERLELNCVNAFTVRGDYDNVVPLGRICESTTQFTHVGLGAHLAKKMGQEGLLFTGNIEETVKRILVIPATYVGITELVKAKMNGIKTVVTGELSPIVRMFANENGISTFELGPFVTEEPGMHRLRNLLALQFPDLAVDIAESVPFVKFLRPYTPT